MFVFVSACMFVMFERLGEPEKFGMYGKRYSDSGSEVVTVPTAIYFLFVTIATVGYGDIFPTNTVVSR